MFDWLRRLLGWSRKDDQPAAAAQVLEPPARTPGDGPASAPLPPPTLPDDYFPSGSDAEARERRLADAMANDSAAKYVRRPPRGRGPLG